MSGIVGIYYRDGRSVDRADLGRMVDTIVHRGPDGASIWCDGAVGLGHRMLHTTPESLHEQLPLTSRCGNYTITADARIDNRDELIPLLDLDDRPREYVSDSAIILAAYQHWGERCPEKLLGDFAFAIWDGRKRHLFCARDHFGVKPFYYYRSDRMFVLASEIKAILSLSDIPQRTNKVRMAEYLVLVMEDKVSTLYQDIYRLPPNHDLIVDREDTRSHIYWSFDPSYEIKLSSDTEYAEAFRDHFVEAVRCRLRSPSAVGTTLSGGLDSSSITCVARELLAPNDSQRLHTFSGIYDDTPICDERPYINAVLEQGGVEPHYCHPDRLSPLAHWKSIADPYDEPLWNAQIALHWTIYEAAQKQNIRVLLDGTGGDTIVSHGTAYLADLMYSGRWFTTISETLALAKRSQRSPWQCLQEWVIAPLTPRIIHLAWRRLRYRDERSRVYDGIPFRSDFVRDIGLTEQLQMFEDLSIKLSRTARQKHCLDITSGAEPFSLEIADRTATLFGVEPRYPFFDRRLAEFCLALPPEQKLRNGWTRMIMRRALGNILPEMVQWRGGKGNLGPSFDELLFKVDRAILEDVVFVAPGPIEDLIDVDLLRQLYKDYHASGNGDQGFLLWRIAMLALWLRRVSVPMEGAIK